MSLALRQATAATLLIGPFVDDTDGKTAETALSIAQADVRLSKNGGDPAQKDDATAATHKENGYYAVPLNATDTGTAGRLRVMVSESGALPVWVDCLVMVANVFDALVAGTDALEVDATQWKGATAPDITAPPSAAAVADAVADELLSGHTVPGSVGAALAAAGSAADPLTNAVPGSYLSGTAGHALGSIGAIKAQTDLITPGSVTVVSQLTAEHLTLVRGDTAAIAFPCEVDLASRTALWLALKRRPAGDADAASVLLVTEAGGLLTLNGSVATVPGASSLGVTAGVSVDWALSASASAQLSPADGLSLALQYRLSDGTVAELAAHTVSIVADVVRAV